MRSTHLSLSYSDLLQFSWSPGLSGLWVLRAAQNQGHDICSPKVNCRVIAF